MPGAGEHCSNADPLLRKPLPLSPFPGLFPGRLPGLRPERRANLEQPDVPVPIGPVVLDPADEPRQEAGAQVRFLTRDRVHERDRVGAVRWPERNGARFEEPGPRELLAHVRLGALDRRVGHGARAVCPQLVREGIVAPQPRDLLDQVHVAGHVGPPAGHLHRQAIVLRRHEEPHRRQQPLDLGALDRDPEQPRHALGAEEDRLLLHRLRPQVEGRLAQLPARHGRDQLDGAAQRVRHAEQVDPPLEAVARLARQLQGAAGAADARRLKVGALEHEIARGLRHLGLATAHHARDDGRPLGVADRRHLGRERALDPVEGDDLLPSPGAPHDDGRAPQLGQVERVQRLVELEEDVVRRVDDVVDCTLTDRGQSVREPPGAGRDRHAADHGDHVARGALGILEPNLDAVDGVEVRLEDPEGAPRYMIAVIRGVTVAPSPRWLTDRLSSVGQRAINNVVDATTYILFELNQPLHAFDLAKLRGPAVIVRRARAREKIVTLDGVERTLTAEMTAICDAERPTIIAGVMGSGESEVSEATRDLVLECAYFQPTRIRRTRRALELSSESSYRFERGIDLLGMPDALRRAVELITVVAGGELREPPLDLWPQPVQEKTIFLRPEGVSRLLGIAVERAEIERLLSSVGFFVAPKDDRLAVQVPGWRPDVTRDVDLVEEVARLRGYDAFPDELRAYRPGTVPDAPVERAKSHVREQLVRAGLLEARTLPIGPPDGPDAVPILNPM